MLQTESYAEASVRYGSPPGDERAASAVSVRMRRQKVLSRVAPPHLAVVIDEAVLARGPERDVMRAQLDHLLAMAQHSQIYVYRCYRLIEVFTRQVWGNSYFCDFLATCQMSITGKAL